MLNGNEKSRFIRVGEVAETLDVSITHAYKVIRDLNAELKAKGYIVTAGRLSRKYFEERMYS
jgi:hypothetical protein